MKSHFLQHISQHAKDQPGKAPVPMGYSSSKPRQTERKTEWVVCEVCRTLVTRKKLNQHMQKVHPRPVSPPPAAAPKKAPQAAAQPALKPKQDPPEIQAGQKPAAFGEPPPAKPPKPKTRMEKRRSGSGRMTVKSPSSRTVRRANSLIDNMTSNRRDIDTSTHGGVSLPTANEPVLPLAEQLARGVENPYQNCPHCKRRIKTEHMVVHIRDAHGQKLKKAKAESTDPFSK